MMRTITISFCLGCLAACAHKAAPSVQPAPQQAPAPVAAEAPSAEPSTLARNDDGAYLGVIDRAGLNAIVEQGLGRMLGRLQLSPVLDGKRFQGFRVAALDPQWDGSGVQTGDVITRLNGAPIERPEQAMTAFDSLRVASEVAVEIVRDGKPMALRYRVE